MTRLAALRASTRCAFHASRITCLPARVSRAHALRRLTHFRYLLTALQPTARIDLWATADKPVWHASAPAASRGGAGIAKSSACLLLRVRCGVLLRVHTCHSTCLACFAGLPGHLSCCAMPQYSGRALHMCTLQRHSRAFVFAFCACHLRHILLPACPYRLHIALSSYYLPTHFGLLSDLQHSSPLKIGTAPVCAGSVIAPSCATKTLISIMASTATTLSLLISMTAFALEHLHWHCFVSFAALLRCVRSTLRCAHGNAMRMDAKGTRNAR